MRRILLFIFTFTLLSAVFIYAQRTVSGTILDGDTGEGLPGVTIQIKGTTTGASTDINGNFSLSASADDVLVVSYVGYLTQEITVGNRTTLDITLASDTELLEEVVVIGYGETTVKDATGAVAAVSSKDFNGGVIASPEQLIQGKTAGVQITSNSGNPGDGVQIRVRGTTSVRSNNNPLFVVDGIPLSGGGTASANVGDVGTTSDVNPLNFINPNDIQSVSILKDASATAIYGSRGANGVVIITTKSGRGVSDQINYSGSISISTVAQEFDLLDRDAFLTAIDDPNIVVGGNASLADFGSNTDWQDYIFRTGVSTKHDISYNKTLDNWVIRPSIGYENQQGIIENSFMERITGRLNGSASFLADRLNLNFSTTYSSIDREDPPLSGSAGFRGDLLGATYSANPTWPSDPTFSDGSQINPANFLENYRSTAVTNRLLANISLDYKLTDDFVVKATYGADYSDADRIGLLTPNALQLGDGIQDFGQGGINNNKSFSNLFELTGRYTKEAGDFKIEGLIGYSIQSFRDWGYFGGGFGFSDASLDAMENELKDSFDAGQAVADGIYGEGNYQTWGFSDIINGDGIPDGTTGFVTALDYANDGLISEFAARPAGVTMDAISGNYFDREDYLQSFFARGNLTFKDKYLLTATFRADGSSRYGDQVENARYGLFPSLAAAWQLHEESFVPEAFNLLKLRVGWGITGNQDGLGYADYTRRTRWEDVNVGGQLRDINFPGLATIGNANPQLKWEETAQTAIGIDFGVNGSRLKGSIDYYYKETDDLLLNVQVAQPANSTQRFENIDNGVVVNEGFELSLGYDVIVSDGLLFNVTGNVARNDNEFRDFPGLVPAGTIRGQGLTAAFAQALGGGQPLFSYYVRSFEGFDDAGQPISDDVQDFRGKSALPIWNAGLSLRLEVGNFDWTAFLTGQFGHHIYNNTQNAFFTKGSLGSGRNVTEDVVNNGESSQAAASVSERFLSPGDFVRMQSMTFGYNIPLESTTIKNLRVTLNMQNLFLITDYSGLDPEVTVNSADFDLFNGLPTAGIDYTAYPRPRTFTLGINATF